MGSDEESLRAVELTRMDRAASLNVADIGCGTGVPTLVLASQLPSATITAVDLFSEFLEILVKQADEASNADRIEARAGSMDALPFAEESFDLIWLECAIYNMGFSNGIKA